MARTSEAVWEGDLKSGKGIVKLGSGAYEGAYSFASRFDVGIGTNPRKWTPKGVPRISESDQTVVPIARDSAPQRTLRRPAR